MSSPSFTQSKSKLINALSVGDLLQAGELAEQFMLRFPDKPEAHYFSGLHSLLARENEKAAQQLEVALGFDDKNLNVLLNLGVAYQRLGKMVAATQAYLAVLAIEPDHIQALINLGSCHYQKKSFWSARKPFQKQLLWLRIIQRLFPVWLMPSAHWVTGARRYSFISVPLPSTRMMKEPTII